MGYELQEGRITESSFGANGSVDSPVFSNTLDNAAALVIYSKATRAGTVEVFRVDVDSVQNSQGTPSAVLANIEDRQIVEHPDRKYFARYTNTDNNAGTIRFSFRTHG
jgi:hypothetical protein